MRGGIGKMDRRVTIQTRTTANDGWGQAIETWSDDVTVWAEYIPRLVSSDLPVEAAQEQFIEKASFIIRYRTIPTDARLTYNGKVYKIQGMAEIGRKDRIELACIATDSNLFE